MRLVRPVACVPGEPSRRRHYLAAGDFVLRIGRGWSTVISVVNAGLETNQIADNTFGITTAIG